MVTPLGAAGDAQSFDMGVLRELAWLDVLQSDTLALSPLRQGVGEGLGAIVQSNRRWRTAHHHQFVQGSDHALSTQPGVDLDAQAYLVELLDNVEVRQSPT